MTSLRTDDPSIEAAVAVASALGTNLDTGLTAQEAAHRLAATAPTNSAKHRASRNGVVSWHIFKTPSSICCLPRSPSRSSPG